MFKLCAMPNTGLHISIKAPGSSHDSLAFHLSALGQILKKHGLPAPYFIVADNAFVCSDWLVVPFKGAKEGSIHLNCEFLSNARLGFS